MNRVEFKSDDGGTVIVEIAKDAYGGSGVQRSGQSIPTITQTVLQKSVSQLKPLTDSISQTLKELNRPSELSIEFGISLSAATGIVVTSAQAEANFKITLRWNNSDNAVIKS